MKRILIVLSLVLIINFTILSAAFLLRPTDIAINLDDIASVEEKPADLFLKGSWGKAEGQFGLYEDGWFAGPMSLAADIEDNLYILDQENKRIQRISQTGEIKVIPIDSSTFEDIAVDEQFIYLLDAVENHLVKKIANDGTIIRTYKISKNIEPISGLILENDQLYIEVAHDKIYRIGTETVTNNKTEADLDAEGEVTVEFKGYYPLDSLKVNGSAQTPAEIKKAFEVYSIISIDSDRNKNMYVVLDIAKNESQYNKAKDRLLGLVLRPDGSLAEKFYASNNYYTSHFRKIAVSPNGTVYQMLTTPEGVEIWRW